MAVTYKDIDLLSNKTTLSGSEKIPVSDTQYITPAQIAATSVASSQPAGGLLPNVLYTLGTLTGSVTISFASPSDNTIENEYKFTFNTGSTAPTITFPNSITGWVGNCLDNGSPLIAASKHYEVSSVNGYAFIGEF